MNARITRRLRKVLRNIPNLIHGYNIYVDADKLRLIDRVYRHEYPSAESFADLGGVWKVNAGYTLYTLKRQAVNRGILVDTDFPKGLRRKLSGVANLQVVQGDFTSQAVIDTIGHVDVVYLFDVLLHQANPAWDAVLSLYTSVASCLVIYNQQYPGSRYTVRLTDLPLEEYMRVAPRGREEFYRYVYAHADEIHPTYRKPWRDVHNIFQWGITDQDLRATMDRLGFREVYFRNYGAFSNLRSFENHGFIFLNGSR
jgi:hypothetical protein